MTTIRQIAQDPRKALIDLEKKLGSDPGELLREMERLSPPGEDWGKHLPYRLATSYYDDEKGRASYESHVDECDYCKTLLDTLHPSSLQAAEFASRAKRLHTKAPSNWTVRTAPYAVAASVVMVVISGGSFIRSASLQAEVKQLQASIDSETPPSVASVEVIPSVTAAAARRWVSDVRIGTGSDATAAITGAVSEPTFSAGQPVHLVTELENAPSHTPIGVVWVGPDNKEVRREINWTRAGDKMIAFTAPDTAEWKVGGYRAELWVADKKVQQAEFDIAPVEMGRQ